MFAIFFGLINSTKATFFILLLKEASAIGVWWGTWAAKNPHKHIQNIKELGVMIASGDITPRVTEEFAMDQYKEAFEVITERRAKGKVILTMN